jgi:hypothetical protein
VAKEETTKLHEELKINTEKREMLEKISLELKV